MTITNALAGIAVFNIDESLVWYQQLLGRPPDRTPQETVAEWEFANGCGIQVFEDSERGGTSSVTLIVTDIDARVDDLKKQDIDIRATATSETSRTASIADPDGNQIVFAQILSKDASIEETASEEAATDQRRAIA